VEIVRIGFTRLLLISAALHVGLLLAVTFWYSRAHHGRASLTSSNEISRLALIFTLHSDVPATGRLVASGNYQPDPNPDGTSAQPLADTTTGTGAAPAPTVALKDQARAHVRWPDSVLSPPSAPRVNSGDGIVFILDVSGSMYEPCGNTTRLALAREFLDQRIHALKNGAPFALVVYGERARRSGPLVPANDATRDAAIRFFNRDYDLGGGTDLPAGFSIAADLDMGAILLVTDGDLNMKDVELFPQVRRILGTAQDSPALTVVGIAPRSDTTDKELLEELAARQGGTYVVGAADGSSSLVTAAKAAPAP
jgi:Mg-chelatase subunit ChlD